MYNIDKMEIGEIVYVRSGGVYGLKSMNNNAAEGEILPAGTPLILLKNFSRKTVDKEKKWIIICLVMSAFGPLWIPEGNLQPKKDKMKWPYIVKYNKPREDAPIYKNTYDLC